MQFIRFKREPPNSAGGVNVYIDWQNLSGKEIKYIGFTAVPYNRVNDIVKSDVGGKTTAGLRGTGPYKVSQLVSGNGWENVWYNSTIDHITLTEVAITFMDNSEVTFDSKQVEQMYFKSILGTWKGGLGDLQFEGSRFLLYNDGAVPYGGKRVRIFGGTFSYNNGVLILDVDGDGMSVAKKWKGQHTGKASLDGDTLKLSDFEGDGATYFLMSFTR